MTTENSPPTATTVYHFNHAGASPSPNSVLDRVRQHLDLEQQIGGYAAAASVVEEMNGIYVNIAKFIHAQSPREIALMASATNAWTRAFYALAEKQQLDHPHRNVILISDAEYAATVVAACQWARTHKWTVLSIPSCTITTKDGKTMSNGVIDVEKLENMLSGEYRYMENGSEMELDPSRIALACITHVPTNSGIMNPVEKIGSMIHDYNLENANQIRYIVDACQSVGQLEVNVEDIKCHALAATGRKYMRGPRGTGFLYIASSIMDDLMPNHVDHFGVPIQDVPATYNDGDAIQDLVEYAPRPDARRFEFWESSAANHLGFGRAVEYAMESSIGKIQKYCISLSDYLRTQLKSIPGVQVHHESSSICGIVTFHLPTVDSLTIKEKLASKGFELSVVPATSTPIDSANMRVPNLLRASISYINTEQEIDLFISTLLSILGAMSKPTSTEPH